jgi:hypothetical protein
MAGKKKGGEGGGKAAEGGGKSGEKKRKGEEASAAGTAEELADFVIPDKLRVLPTDSEEVTPKP